ncbi:DUF2304 domain-containing protein [uncultured Methanobrevibacter sp.]|uniref:DUF2304 domain-containing protein n=1 Tax=uncultured Methanobrevibacter sp. TaxID=253161 RepID=UPI0025D7A6C5|nr:DUF2304 domain-containing protein [uncultured Methanobrevibacter sp.]
MTSPLLYQVLVIILAIISIILLTIRYKNKKLTTFSLFIIIIFWLIIISIGLFPEETTIVAHFFGLKRGFDLIFCVSIGFLAYIILRINLIMNKQNEELTKIIRKIAIENEETVEEED